ncbi:MAG: hypothetical protein A2846_03210 [Candidatus Doudnabacteria bacterium RIFCSPHIGHO2_01_FULL_49_9]|uniref:Carbamoyltransferase n=1 Tax=Candidatus Doudnabacteria bacterium RIFCSPHIGHO2_01_FULL_49_9 TaxID=1817827 RepID=A0A1F5NYI8_9BACT|nr:MAG: hypothetical protein A2846_03210 [Candidatus Doudnabacteria bacterium RIFCSPHIGHO2_01_FULL_49_9]
MKILGINQVPGMFAWVHDSAAALVSDGRLVASAEEERFSRVRHAKGYPRQAIAYCLKEGGLSKNDIDVLAVSHDPYKFLRQFPWNLHWRTLAPNIFNLGVFWFFRKFVAKEFPRAKIVYVSHHLSHAASTYRCSGFDEANILTVDGAGETETFTFWTGKNGVITKVWDIPLAGLWGARHPKSIGLVYSRVTNFLGLGTNGEGKTMGLASYGQPIYDFKNILDIEDHRRYRIDRGAVSRLYGDLARKADEPLTEKHKNFAASLQRALEDSLFNLAREAYGKTGIRKFCLAGGVALNCNMNSRIMSADFCDGLFVQPACYDGGIAMGAALEAAARLEKVSPMFRMENAYWGPGYGNDEIETLLREARVPYVRHENVPAAAAKLLAEGQIVGWFQGRMELGPRALGNRSILADPTVPGMNDRINTSIKHREQWRPFAPIVAEEDGAKYFDDYKQSPFMLLTFLVKEAFRPKLPAITHIDGSARIQTLNATQNPRLYAVLREFEKLRGVPMVLNTSFNDAGEPIVCSPKDALRCFYSTGLDALVMGDYILTKIKS